jgi:hypothetical protein
MVRRCAVLVAIALASACAQSGPRTAEKLRKEIEAYQRAEPSASEERIAALFARLDADIAALRADELAKPSDERTELTREREALAAERRELQAVYVQARVARLGVAAEEALRGMAEQIGRGFEDLGRTLRESGREQGTP